MLFFNEFCSNTYAGSGNQLYFSTNNEIKTGRVFYKISTGGEYNYSILFSNIIDSTYSDGSLCHKNYICDSWMIHSAKIGKCKNMDISKSYSEMIMGEDIIVDEFKEITFAGLTAKKVMPGEFFSSDPIKYNFEKDEFICIELTFSGNCIPYHEESMMPVFVKDGEGWKHSKHMPFAGMIGCDRAVKTKVAYIGDSITQGCGTTPNKYSHWNAFLSEMIGEEYSFWNLGLGFGRANDAASDGAWLFKAKQNDIIFVCYGVNDILQGQSEEQIKKDLETIVKTLKKEGKTVILQTVPPFDYQGHHIRIWENINNFIKNELKDIADHIFDNVQCLGKEDIPSNAKFGGHPNDDGCYVWAKALYEDIKHMF